MMVIVEYRSWPSSICNLSLTLICSLLSEPFMPCPEGSNAKDKESGMQPLELTVKLMGHMLFHPAAQTSVENRTTTAIIKQVMK